MSSIYSEHIRITYYDLDCFGRFKLSAFLRAAHIAADANARQLGCGFNDLAPLNMSFVLQRFSVEAARLPEYGETVNIRTWPAAVEKGTFLRCGDIRSASEQVLMEWTSLWVLLDLKERKILRPAALPNPLSGEGFLDVKTRAQKIAAPDGAGEMYSKYRHTVLYSEVDTNRHMNNTCYGDVIDNALHTGGRDAGAWAAAQINYLAEARLGGEIDVECRKYENIYLLSGKTGGNSVFAASVTMG